MKNIASLLSALPSIVATLALIVVPMTFVDAGGKKDATKSKTKTIVSQKIKRVTKQTSPKSVETSTSQQTSPSVLTKPSPATGEQIKWHVLSSGGTSGTSTDFSLLGTVAQTAVGSGSSADFGLNSGFWQDFVTGTCCSNGIAGDADDGGDVNIGDAIFIVKYAFEEGSPKPPCCDQADSDGGGDVNIGDAVYIVKFAFEEGAPVPICPPSGPLACL